MPKLRHYQADKADRIFLHKLNKKRVEANLPIISETTFGAVLDQLEITCYQAIHHDLLAPLDSSAACTNAEYDENACCDICRQVLLRVVIVQQMNRT
ncbi:unnamed protein product [Gongylonema pulchrum]|uniref:Transposase n=1 Tax=Gongylonema pulchrum TaxID=637853 RepID=A0A183D757_9BILA|nr:unnamed protein product [Gongylonema pulchrum]